MTEPTPRLRIRSRADRRAAAALGGTDWIADQSADLRRDPDYRWSPMDDHFFRPLVVGALTIVVLAFAGVVVAQVIIAVNRGVV